MQKIMDYLGLKTQGLVESIAIERQWDFERRVLIRKYIILHTFKVA